MIIYAVRSIPGAVVKNETAESCCGMRTDHVKSFKLSCEPFGEKPISFLSIRIELLAAVVQFSDTRVHAAVAADHMQSEHQ